jgi:hypothetical protein
MKGAAKIASLPFPEVKRLARLLAVMLAFFCLAAAALAGSNEKKFSKRPRAFEQSKRLLTAEDIKEAEQRLFDLGYWTGSVDGKADDALYHALVAFQKMEGRKRTGKLAPEELEALRSARRPTALEGGYFHIEIDKARQVLFVVDESGIVAKILPVSTGSDKPFTSEGWTRTACTPTGRFTVYRKIAGWRKSPLGLLHYPNYICGGVAIHGNPSVPVTPQSHGCIRIPMFASKEFSRLTPVGTLVIVHDGSIQP